MPRPAPAPPASTMTLPTDTEILLVRSFAAPRALVWRAFTEPALLRRWMGLASTPLTVCEMDVRPGGTFRWAWGEAFETRGVIHEVQAPRRLVMESMAPDPTPEVRTITFDESAGRTTVTMRIKAATKAIRDEMLASGAVEGMEPTFVRLDALLPEWA